MACVGEVANSRDVGSAQSAARRHQVMWCRLAPFLPSADFPRYLGKTTGDEWTYVVRANRNSIVSVNLCEHLLGSWARGGDQPEVDSGQHGGRAHCALLRGQPEGYTENECIEELTRTLGSGGLLQHYGSEVALALHESRITQFFHGILTVVFPLYLAVSGYSAAKIGLVLSLTRIVSVVLLATVGAG